MRSFVITTFALAVALAPAATFAQIRSSSRLPGSSRPRAAACGAAAAGRRRASTGGAEDSIRNSGGHSAGADQARPDRGLRRNDRQAQGRDRKVVGRTTEAAGFRTQGLQVVRAVRSEHALRRAAGADRAEGRVRPVQDAAEDDDPRRAARAGDGGDLPKDAGSVCRGPQQTESDARRRWPVRRGPSDGVQIVFALILALAAGQAPAAAQVAAQPPVAQLPARSRPARQRRGLHRFPRPGNSLPTPASSSASSSLYKTADFEMVMGRVKEALEKSEVSEAQAAGPELARLQGGRRPPPAAASSTSGSSIRR